MKIFDFTKEKWNDIIKPIDDTPCIHANDNIDYQPLYDEVMADLQDLRDNPIYINHDFSIFPCEVVYIGDFR
jgi:hypothetical protein